MKKRIFAIVLSVILAFTLTFSAFAADIERFTDAAKLLSESEAAELNSKLDEMSERLQFDIAVITVDSLDGCNIDELAETIWDDYNFGYGENKDGVMLLLAMEDRDWVITSTGWGQDYINESGRSMISSTVVPYLSSGDYYGAFTLFADMCENLVQNYDENSSYNDGDYQYTYYKSPFNFGVGIVVAVAVGALAALIAVSSMKSKMKSVRAQSSAANYVVDNSIKLTNTSEKFLYSSVTKTARTQNNGNNTNRSGGGASHSGHSTSHGKF